MSLKNKIQIFLNRLNNVFTWKFEFTIFNKLIIINILGIDSRFKYYSHEELNQHLNKYVKYINSCDQIRIDTLELYKGSITFSNDLMKPVATTFKIKL